MSALLRQPIDAIAEALVDGRTTARALVEAALATVDADDSARPVFLHRFDAAALGAADAVDAARAAGEALPPFAGVPFAVKDLFDVAGEVTMAGSVVLADAAAAEAHAPVVQHLIDAGFILIGKTNMTEFAFSGLGINPHYGTPPASHYPAIDARAPGGSSSGAGVSLGRGMVPLSLGTDTAGSCRIPAAWNRVVGHKPSQSSLSSAGVFPLSPSFDAPGPLAHSVACARTAFRLMAALPRVELQRAVLADAHLLVPEGVALDDLDPAVRSAFEAAVARIESAGARISRRPVPEFATAAEVFAQAPIATVEAAHGHRERLAASADRYDPFVAARIQRGDSIDPALHEQNLQRRERTVALFGERMAELDGLLLPTTAILPPPLAPLEAPDNVDHFGATNGRALRNTALINFVDGCAVSLPLPEALAGAEAIGLSVCHSDGRDEQVFEVAAAIEALLAE